ncbi:MAG: LPS export ABC transporter periplasmic protein LptC [Candidatus Omnitrophica bacterium CG07_land_8_20_14_0_80_42_15]|uniref:LPS export ABC transporter periplasmic protein LptC n=1 Tax=Candidatus Aquitaenariimonas noxiae TaxID=1974741 RepID=A0A2J0KVK0_9BACT|nr:MAG: LPS export ABC transporter periplasmic protein LptC [Candidatus Omnitrophica bacterium CG07_land_8_20_14_0_80_42_15]
MYRLLAVSIILILALSGCGKKKEPLANPDAIKAAGIGQKILQFELTAYTDRGVKRWEVKGESANVVDEVVELKNVIATTYRQDTTLTLEADEGFYNRVSSKVHLEKNVVVTTGDGGRLLTDALDWDSKNNIITTDKPVLIKRQEINLWGTGAKGEPELKKAQFVKHIKIEMDKGATHIICDGPLDIDYENNVAFFNDNVRITDEKGEITSDKLDAYLNPQTKTIVKAIARGRVKILRNENYSYSDEAIYLAESHKVILTGRPRIVIYPDEKFDASFFGDKNE